MNKSRFKKNILWLAFLLLTSGMHADEISVGCDRFKILFSPDGTLEKVVSSKEVINPEESSVAPESRNGKSVDSLFSLELQQTVYGLKDGKRRTIPLNSVSRRAETLVLSSTKEQGVHLTFDATNQKDYLTLRLINVETPQGEHATKMEFKSIAALRIFPLDPEVIKGRGKSVVFSGLLKRSPLTKLGAVALWYPENEAMDDEILYQVWAQENLPHPKVDGEWTVQRAKQWVTDYIKEFAHYSELYITGETLQELKDCVDYAAKMKMSTVYMHLATWSGRYWPEDKTLYALNEKLFPNGHADFKELVDYAQAQGVRVGLRTLSNGISLKNPDYVSEKPDKRLSHFWCGTLVKAIEPDSTELVIKSDRTLPTSYNTRMARGFYDFVHIDDEILQYKGSVENKDGTITLKVASKGNDPVRGYGWTKAAAHQSGAPVKILMGAVGDKATPDHDSTLLDQLAGDYADFNNKMHLITCSFDGLMIYGINTDYGKTKFPGAVYSKLDHPTFCETSGGPPQWGWFEQEFNSVRKALGLDKTRAIPQRMTLMLGVHQDTWPAPSPYGYSYAIVPNAVASFLWCSIQNQNGLHDINLDTFRNFGLLAPYTKAIQQWREYGPGLPDTVKERIFGAYDGSPKYPLQVEHFRFEERGNELEVVPFRPMRRKVGDRGWGYIQEHGPVYTYQYMRPNTIGLVQVGNPYHKQVPEFIIRVMKEFDREMLTGFVDRKDITRGENERLNKILYEKDMSDGKVQEHDQEVGETTGQVNYRIMIPLDSTATLKKGEMELEIKSDGARITYENKSSKVKMFDLEGKAGGGMVTYTVSSSINNAKGLGVVIIGDGSHSLFVIRVRGGGTRDYVIPIDFKGRRYIEIPDPQVSWSEERWPITKAWKRFRSDTITSVVTGLAIVPPNTKASVFVEEIRLLPEKISALIDPVVQCGSGTISIKGQISSDNYIWYKPGGKAEVFDLNWNKTGELPVVVSNAEVPTGPSDIRVTNNNEAGDPWLECQFFVRDKPIHRITIK